MGNVLNQEQLLRKGESLKSENGEFTLDFQDDGNLVVYRIADKHVFFASHTNGKNVDAAKFQADGNFVVYHVGGKKAAWSSNTHGKNGKYLKLENYGDLVIYSENGTMIWSSIFDKKDQWMSLLSDQLTLSEICLPGSHDSGMYETTNTQKGLACTQNYNLKEQLAHGVRYFDLRPRHFKGKGIYMVHDLADGPHLTKVMPDVLSFIKEHPKETVILNFSHFKDFEENFQDQDFVNDIGRGLENYYLGFPKDTDLWRLPLKDLRGRVIILVSRSEIFNPFMAKHPSGGLFYQNDGPGSGERIYDHYANKNDYNEMLQDQKDKYVKFINDANDKRLFLLNWTLTAPSETGWDKTKTVLSNFFWKAKVKKYADEINPKLISEFHANLDLFKPSVKNKKVNIINHDYVDLIDTLAICRYVTAINP